MYVFLLLTWCTYVCMYVLYTEPLTNVIKQKNNWPLYVRVCGKYVVNIHSSGSFDCKCFYTHSRTPADSPGLRRGDTAAGAEHVLEMRGQRKSDSWDHLGTRWQTIVQHWEAPSRTVRYSEWRRGFSFEHLQHSHERWRTLQMHCCLKGKKNLFLLCQNKKKKKELKKNGGR